MDNKSGYWRMILNLLAAAAVFSILTVGVRWYEGRSAQGSEAQDGNRAETAAEARPEDQEGQAADQEALPEEPAGMTEEQPELSEEPTGLAEEQAETQPAEETGLPENPEETRAEEKSGLNFFERILEKLFGNPEKRGEIGREASSAGQALAGTAAGKVVSSAVTTASSVKKALLRTALASIPVEEVPIDFETLWQTCPDVYAWIRIPDTNIDYPVCRLADGDQGFYLDHQPDGTPAFAGSIYAENYNSADFKDPVTVFYGHDMSDGSMFQNLHYYEDQWFFENNREVTVYLPDNVLHYRIFAAYDTDDGHLLLNNGSFQDPKVFYEYFREVLKGNFASGLVDTGTELTPASRILTLSTCNAYEDQRFLVQCVLTNPEVLRRGELYEGE